MIPSTVQLRPMRATDLPQISEMECQIYEFPWTLGNFKDSLQAGYSCWILMEDGVLAGYAVVMMGVEEAHLLNLSIARRFRRKRFGRHLMGHLVALARECEARRFLLEVRDSNAPARNFYAAYGFTTVGLRRGYYPTHIGREDAIIMELAL